MKISNFDVYLLIPAIIDKPKTPSAIYVLYITTTNLIFIKHAIKYIEFHNARQKCIKPALNLTKVKTTPMKVYLHTNISFSTKYVIDDFSIIEYKL